MRFCRQLISTLFFLFILSFFVVPQAFAATYYVSNTDGHDTNCNGIAETPYISGSAQDCPWRTIAKINASSFLPGDSILLKSGDLWREELAIPSAGDSTAKITISSYGSGNKPKIYGSDVPVSWTQENGEPVPDPINITLVQGVSIANSGAVSNVAYSTVPTAGNLLVAVGWGTNSDTNASILGWTKVVSSKYIGSSYMALFYKVATTDEQTMVSLNWAGSGQTRLAIEEWSGLVNPTLDQVASTITTGVTVTSVSSGTTLVTTVPNELIIAAFGHGSSVSNRSYSNGFVENINVNNSNIWQVASQTVSSVGSYETRQSWTTARQAGGLIATFKGDNSNGTGTGTGTSSIYSTQWSTNPSDIWFINIDGNVVTTPAKTSKTALLAEYDWWYDTANTRLYIYSPTHPQERYSSIEIANPARDRGIGWIQARHGYVDVDNIEVAFVNGVGIVLRGNSNITNTLVHHISAANSHGYGLEINTGSNNVISNNIVYETGAASFYTTASYDDHVNSNIVVEYNTFSNAKTQLVLISTGSTGLLNENNIVRYNTLFHTPTFVPKSGQGHAIRFVGRSGAIFRNASAYYNSIAITNGNGILIDNYVTNTAITNNTISSQLGRGIVVFGTGTSQITLRNNLVANAGINALRVVNKTSITDADNNLFYAINPIAIASVNNINYTASQFASYKTATGWDTNGVWSNPFITSLIDRNFSLQANSPAIDAGSVHNYPTDIAGVSLPQGNGIDIGAFEYLSN